MIETLITLGIAIVIVVVLWYVFKSITHLIINSIVGIILLMIFNYFNILGMGDIPINIWSVLVCALGGIPGFIILLLLNAVGITV